jgi:putative redox protein
VDASVRPGFTAVRVEVSVTGPESAERYAELAAAVDQHCPVLDLFQNPVPVTRVIAAS